MLRLTAFSHAALLLCGGLLLGLFLSKWGWGAYAATVAALLLFVLLAEWRSSAPVRYTHEEQD
jgi:hypothetical protein